MNRRLFAWLATPLLGLSLAATAVHAAPSSAAQPFGISLSSSVQLIGAPCSVAPDVLESNDFIRAFPERLAYALPADTTVLGPNGAPTVLAQGTLVDSYFVHADWINGGQNAPKKFAGSLTKGRPGRDGVATAPVPTQSASLGARRQTSQGSAAPPISPRARPHRFDTNPQGPGANRGRGTPCATASVRLKEAR